MILIFVEVLFGQDEKKREGKGKHSAFWFHSVSILFFFFFFFSDSHLEEHDGVVEERDLGCSCFLFFVKRRGRG